MGKLFPPVFMETHALFHGAYTALWFVL